MKKTLSIAIATYNDAEFIKRCLDSIKTIADEIVVYNASSTDNTLDILKEYKKVKIISGPNNEIFHINKQKAIDTCTKDWILQLDTDEVVSKSLAKEINELLSQAEIKDNGYWINRSNYFLGKFLKKGGQYPDSTLRLYKNGDGRLPCKDVHEQAIVNGTVGNLTSDLLHYADSSFSRYMLRNNRYTSIIANQLKNPAFFDYFFTKPISWFLLTYIRHKGFQDGFPGFVFSYFSALRFPAAYVKHYEQKHKSSN